MRSHRLPCRHLLLAAVSWLALLGVACSNPPVAAEPSSQLKLTARIPLSGVEGRIDHLTLDREKNRLFVAALGNDTVEVIDLNKHLWIGRIEEFHEPQGVLFLSNPGRLLVTNGGDGSLSIIRGADLQRINTVRLREDPDNIRFEPDAGRVWIGAGAGATGGLAALDSKTGQLLFEVGLTGHPESFQLEAQGPLIYVNVPATQEVAVVDRERREVVAAWRLPCSGNFPMAIDEAGEQILIGCRRPARILALDIATGKVKAEVHSPGDVDDVFVDSSNRRAYASGGEGLLRVYSLTTPGLETVGEVPTGRGARTCMFDASSGHLYVAAPRDGSRNAEILVFTTNR